MTRRLLDTHALLWALDGDERLPAPVLADLELHHRDPFDRMLIAQARDVGLPIVTADRAFAAYDVAVHWPRG